MIPRFLSRLLTEKLSQFPAVALLGARQSGKTTLARSLGGSYFDLEQTEDQLKLDLRWDALVESDTLIILDEAHAFPRVFPKIRSAIDKQRWKKGRFLLLGSIAPALMKEVSESLAGRLALCELSPLLLVEMKNRADENDLWLYGGFPDGGILEKKQFPGWQKDYLALLAQRDLPHWGLHANPQTTLRLFKMLAAYHGQIWNASMIGASLGLSYHTVNRYLNYLENAYLILRLAPFHANIRKRLIKSPKIYWQDSGLLHALFGISDTDMLLSQPWVGASWEGWVLNQILSSLKAAGKSFEVYFFRTSGGQELDLVLELSKKLWAFEFKLTSVPGPEDMKRLNQVADLIKADKRILLTRTAACEGNEKNVSANLTHCLDLLLA